MSAMSAPCAATGTSWGLQHLIDGMRTFWVSMGLVMSFATIEVVPSHEADIESSESLHGLALPPSLSFKSGAGHT